MSSPYAYIELMEAFKKPGCPLCRVTQRAVRRFLEGLFYEKVNDWGLREQLRKSKGFCNAHAWLILESSIGNSLGVAIIYNDTLTGVLKQLPATPGSARRQGWLSRLLGRSPPHLARVIEITVQALAPQARCPACEEMERSTYLYLSELINSAENAEFSAAFASSQGPCLPHVSQVFALVEDEGTFNWLLRISREKLETINAELAEFVRKSDHRYIKEGYGEERDAWRRILTITTSAHPLNPMD